MDMDQTHRFNSAGSVISLCLFLVSPSLALSIALFFFSCTQDVSNVENFSKLFNNAKSFNQNLEAWNMAMASDLTSMFENATSFNQPLAAWNTSNVIFMDYTFAGATSFNQPLNGWNTSQVQ
jgi:surface protein